mmetsp:Transcript_4975/g.16091  ORF Transcript_4975/g.16091 Transcript_4975/m.16091 type:complete len:333 (-) Transcript_4975:505-1503(-)
MTEPAAEEPTPDSEPRKESDADEDDDEMASSPRSSRSTRDETSEPVSSAAPVAEPNEPASWVLDDATSDPAELWPKADTAADASVESTGVRSACNDANASATDIDQKDDEAVLSEAAVGAADTNSDGVTLPKLGDDVPPDELPAGGLPIDRLRVPRASIAACIADNNAASSGRWLATVRSTASASSGRNDDRCASGSSCSAVAFTATVARRKAVAASTALPWQASSERPIPTSASKVGANRASCGHTSATIDAPTACRSPTNANSTAFVRTKAMSSVSASTERSNDWAIGTASPSPGCESRKAPAKMATTADTNVPGPGISRCTTTGASRWS